MKTKAKASYRIRNWAEYDAALGQRGSVTFWLSEEVIGQWRLEQKTGRRGASNYYSDVAIATMATVQSVFHLAIAADGRLCGVAVHIDGNRCGSAGSLDVIEEIGKIVGGIACST